MGRVWKAAQQLMSRLVLIVLATTAVATFTTWRLAKLNEREHIHKMTRLAASAVEADLRSDMEAWMLGQIRLAKMWEFEEPTYSQWSAFAGLYLEHHPGCVAIVWLDPKYQERWVSRAPGERVPLAGNGAMPNLLLRAQDSHQATLSKLLTSPAGKKQWLTVVPIYQKSRFRGYVLGYFEVQRSLESMLDDIKGLNFSVAIREDGVLGFKLPLSSAENENPWAQSVDVSFPDSKWQLEVWPRLEAMRDMQSNLPGTVLLFGLAAGVLLVAVARFHESLRASQARFAGILEISAEAVISTDEKQNITLFNRAAETIFGYTADEALGKSLDLLIPERFRAIHRAHVERFVKSDKNSLLMSDRRRVFGRRKDGGEFHMAASISKLEVGGQRTLTVICSDVSNEVHAEDELRKAHDELELRVRERTAELETSNQNLRAEIAERKRAEEAVQELSRRMLRVQEEERRKLARELHDGATQNLVTLSLNIARIRKSAAGVPTPDAILAEWMQMAEDCINELRTISYLLHPPLLEELGLTLTLRGFVEGFAKRSGIAVTMSMSGELDKAGFDVELAVFRILQEGLSNIHRHSQSRTATVLASCDGHTLTLEIADQGNGIPAGSAEGVGMASMRERVRLLKGELAIKTGLAGTTIIVRLPMSDMASSTNTAA
ncbi:MAG TPA: PAS domain S-box protein [Candidatus Angelobacter sp.]|jgi:two-component system sensor kinase|nr:PAS domain S-box protein [Candidatus Angelobacter sp.]